MRMAVVTIIGLLFCFGQTKEAVVKKDIKEGMLARAGQEALSCCEKELKEAEDEIMACILEFGEDKVISGKEMIALRKKVVSLVGREKEALKRIKIYDLELDPELRERIRVMDKTFSGYFELSLQKGDHNGSVRKFFAQLTGKDFRVEGRLDTKQLIILVLVVLASAILFVLGAILDHELLKRIGGVGATLMVLGIILALYGLI